MGKPESLRKNFGIWDFNERHNKHICVPADAGKVNGQLMTTDNLMIYAYKTQDIASCKTLIYFSTKFTKLFPVEFYFPVINHLQKKSFFFPRFSFMM